CGACADVCDTVMDKMGYARGLVKYSTQNAIKNKWTSAETWRHVFRPRVLVYTSILAGVCIAMLVSLALRTPFKVDVVRDRGVMARIVAGGMIENVYRLQVMNATESEQHYRLTVSGLPGLAVASEDQVVVESTQSRWVAVRVQLPYEAAAAGTHPIYFEITARDSSAQLREKSVFLVPR
ncbi:MAG: FixG Ig-like domain-containing protein, partial [Hylemonella sp.]